jgi:hypothetical protein
VVTPGVPTKTNSSHANRRADDAVEPNKKKHSRRDRFVAAIILSISSETSHAEEAAVLS